MEDGQKLPWSLRAQLFGLGLIAALTRLLGDGGCRGLSRALGGLIWRALPKRRAVALNNLELLPDADQAERARIGRRSMDNHVLSMLTSLRNRPEDDWAGTEAAEPDLLEALRRETRPVIIVTGHFGAWELLMSGLDLLLPGRKLNAMGYRQSPEAVHQIVTRTMRAHGVKHILSEQGLLTACAALREPGSVLSVQIDQNTVACSQAVFLPFLGKKAAVMKSSALMAVRTGALVWPAYLPRTEKGCILRLDPPIDPLTLSGGREEKINEICAYYNSSLERMVLQYPEQWLWMHRRWRTRPPEESATVEPPEQRPSS